MTRRWELAVLRGASMLSAELGGALAEARYITPHRGRCPDHERAVLATASTLRITTRLRAPRWTGRSCGLAAWRWGSGATVLLLHGWEGRGAQLGAFVPPLVAAGMSVVMFDAPGHGDSEGRQSYLTDLAGALADVVATIGPVRAIVAHSLGAASVVLAHHLHGITVARNVLLAPGVRIDELLARFARTHGLGEAARRCLDYRLAMHSGLPPDARALDLVVTDHRGHALIVHDHHDREVPVADAERLARAWPDSRLHATTGLGHVGLLRDPRVIAEVVEFIAT